MYKKLHYRPGSSYSPSRYFFLCTAIDTDIDMDTYSHGKREEQLNKYGVKIWFKNSNNMTHFKSENTMSAQDITYR